MQLQDMWGWVSEWMKKENEEQRNMGQTECDSKDKEIYG